MTGMRPDCARVMLHRAAPDCLLSQAADCCHLNGFCMDEKDGNRLAYATVVGPSDESQGWRAHRTGGGQVWDCRRNRVVCEGLSMPHSPRMHNGKLWVLEAGTGWLGWVDLKASPKEAEKLRSTERANWRAAADEGRRCAVIGGRLPPGRCLRWCGK